MRLFHTWRQVQAEGARVGALGERKGGKSEPACKITTTSYHKGKG